MSAIVLRCQSLPVYSEYGRYRPHLRVDFWFSCAYCSVAEAEARGVGFQIDHYDPTGSRTDYNNLYYACEECNRAKSNHPVPDGIRRPKFARFIQVDMEDPDDHVEVIDSRVRHRTDVGEFNIEALRLNRKMLQRVRDLRASLDYSDRQIAHGLRSLRNASIDLVPPGIRGAVLKTRESLRRAASAADGRLQNALAAYCSSELLDADPDAATHAKIRRDYLRRINCILPRKKV